jgi:hypothetical protein
MMCNYIVISIVVHGVESDGCVPLIGGAAKPSEADEFLNLHPKLRITELIDTTEDGVYAVFGEITGIVDGQEWWYTACKCHRAVMPDSGAYYCSGCGKHVFHVVPRFKVKIHVSDGENVGVFVLFDSDMSYIMEKSCAYFVAKSKVSVDLLSFLDLLVKHVLYIVCGWL